MARTLVLWLVPERYFCHWAILAAFISCSCWSDAHGQLWEYVERPTKYGDIRGYSVGVPKDAEMRMDVFAGVPYARPPLGELRFRPPEEPQPWTGTVYNATEFSPCCPQDQTSIKLQSFGPFYDNSHEDCLYLNIHAPRNLSQPDAKYPVMVMIHGGSFTYGSGEEYNGEELARQGAVHVGINYRLGVLGFLSTDDEEAAGNYGTKDAVQALVWIKENIGNFGGDPDLVTIFGNSAGGRTVSLLMFTDYTNGLFHRVIAQSGDAVAMKSLYRPPVSLRPHSLQLAQLVGCPTSFSATMLDCLRTKDAFELVDAHVTPPPGMFAWTPRLDGDFFKAAPEELLKQGDFRQVPLMTGTVKDEATFFSVNYPGIAEGFSKSHKEELMYNRGLMFGEHSQLMYAAFKHQYNRPGDNYTGNRDDYLALRGDEDYSAPVYAHAAGHAAAGLDAYFYSFEYRSPRVIWPKWMGVPHTEELAYIYGVPFWNDSVCPWICRNVMWPRRLSSWEEDDLQASRRMIEAWINFARTGKPTSSAVNWPRLDAAAGGYVTMDAEWTADAFYRFDRMHFWNVYSHELLNTTVKCAPQPTAPPPSPPASGSKPRAWSLTDNIMMMLATLTFYPSLKAVE